jgi:type IV fimbrial biogenesis protein FimT
MVTVAIIAILAAVAAPNFSGTTDSTRVRKTADLIAQTMALTRSEALDKNSNRWLTIKAGTPPTVCISTTDAHTCDVRDERVAIGATVTPLDTPITFSGANGAANPKKNSFTVSSGSHSRTVCVNFMGIVRIVEGACS